MNKAGKKSSASCDVMCVNIKRVARVRKGMKPGGTIGRLAATFKALGDPTRVKIISALLLDELCVCDIASLIGLSQSAISHQLRVLRNMNLVKYRKDGRIAYYSLDDDHISAILTAGLKHAEE
jgi:ArsR family transcriptional regulator, lead/cadmium/zinc/bismuth-responsive transcriptional repressor